jgi:hypothetical protein
MALAATQACISAVGSFTPTDATRMLHWDAFLLGITACSGALPAEMRLRVSVFLRARCENDRPYASLAVVILIAAPTLVDSKRALFDILIRILIRRTFLTVATRLFAAITMSVRGVLWRSLRR